MAQIIEIAAALLTNGEGQTLLVRKRGTTAFMQPGGKIDAGETPLDALLRELGEELAITPPSAGAVYLGCFEAPAANEPGATVVAHLFHLTTAESVRPAAEIAEAVWIDPEAEHGFQLAPLTRDVALPLLASLKPS